MPLGLPNHLAPRNVAAAYASATHGIALFCLIACLIYVAALQVAVPQLALWSSFVAIMPMLVALYLLDRYRTGIAAIAYLLVVGACVYWSAIAGILVLGTVASGELLTLTYVKLAAVLVGAGRRTRPMLLWLVAGYLVAELAVILATVAIGARWSFDTSTFVAFAALAALLSLIEVFSMRTRSVQPIFTRAMRDEMQLAIRVRMEAKAAAIMHDMVLSQLAAISSTPGPELPDATRSAMERDLEVFVGEEWLLDPGDSDAEPWQSSSLTAAIDEVRALGLTVAVSGDPAALAPLDPPRSQAIALAVKQCLINVLRHSGVSTAEVVIYSSDDEISIMVVDAGRGFSQSATGSDRLGLRQSVRQRIEAVSGTVQIWSTPGRGTSVVIRLPLGPVDGHPAPERELGGVS